MVGGAVARPAAKPKRCVSARAPLRAGRLTRPLGAGADGHGHAGTVDDSSIASLMASFKQEGESGPRAAIGALARRQRDAIPLLEEAFLTSRSAHIRAWSITALAEFKGRRAASYFRKALRDPSMSVRLRAVVAIAERDSVHLSGRTTTACPTPIRGRRWESVGAKMDEPV